MARARVFRFPRRLFTLTFATTFPTFTSVGWNSENVTMPAPSNDTRGEAPFIAEHVSLMNFALIKRTIVINVLESGARIGISHDVNCLWKN